MAHETFFHPDVWQPALEKYAAVTRLTVQLFDREARLACGPVNPTALFEILAADRDSMVGGCLHDCLAQEASSPGLILTRRHALAVAGTPLRLAGRIVGCAVIGHVLTDVLGSAAVARLAEETGLDREAVRGALAAEVPVPERRLVLYGELLRVLGEALVRERDRTRQHEELSQRLAEAAGAKDRLLAVLSHELRTPLTPILTWAQVLQRESDQTRVRNAAATIERNARLEEALVEDLLDVSRLAQGELAIERRPRNLTAIVRAAVEETTRSAGDRGVRLDWAEPPQALAVDADAGRLQRVFVSVLSNAVKFTPRDGSVRLTVDRDGGDAVVWIRDTGLGIAPEFLPLVFDAFRQAEQGTRRQYGGLGVGLTLTKRLTELHGGSIQAASAGIGQGTEFTIRLPLAGAAVQAGPDAEQAAGPAGIRLAGVTVLVVEDHVDSREATRLILEELGARVLVAEDGVQALEVVETETPDLVLCDLRMPRLDGFELIRRLRQDPRHANRAAVSVSGFATAADRQRSREAGFDEHLGKPFDNAALVAALTGALRRRGGDGSRRDLAA